MKAKITLFLIAAVLFIAGNIHYTNTPVNQDTITPTETPAVTPVRTLVLTAVGDCTFATDSNADKETGFVTYAAENGYDYFFKNVRSLFSEDDLTLVNFEGTISENGEREAKQFAFRGDPEYVKIQNKQKLPTENLRREFLFIRIYLFLIAY